MDPTVMLTSSAQPWSSYVMMVVVDLCGLEDGRYPVLATASHRGRGSIKIVKGKGERVSPCRVPLWMWIGAVLPCMVI